MRIDEPVFVVLGLLVVALTLAVLITRFDRSPAPRKRSLGVHAVRHACTTSLACTCASSIC
jgi:hypothetical protein